ncbi:hypothetical protein EJC47_00130 [Sphingomonas sp. TF3]|uniref:hypothetical protein n=1 Tax=Sphingomonas sp. TF3 TaxID=2495580 RepID=UPI000F881213|nr:hypothetical protein [Sphingomonas sp. TF3]RUN78327.1 hypothetical protein EJC47_00130 [Sphingomonas sp. TF3]
MQAPRDLPGRRRCRWHEVAKNGGYAATLFAAIGTAVVGERWLASCLEDHLAAMMILLIGAVIVGSLVLPLFTRAR